MAVAERHMSRILADFAQRGLTLRLLFCAWLKQPTPWAKAVPVAAQMPAVRLRDRKGRHQ